MSRFHSEDYVNFLKRVSPETVRPFLQQMTQFNVGECTVFGGVGRGKSFSMSSPRRASRRDRRPPSFRLSRSNH